MSEVPPIVSEFFLALEFGWTLDYIRNLRYRDVDIMTTLLNLYYRMQIEGKHVSSRATANALAQIMK